MQRAAADFTTEDLRGRFALAVLPGAGNEVGLPVPAADGSTVLAAAAG